MIPLPMQRQEFIRVCQRACRCQMQTSSGGNLSVKLEEDRLLVKPSGISLYELKEEDLLITDTHGNVVDGRGRPTKEINTHLGIYRVRPEISAIVHYHPPHSTAFAVCHREIPLRTLHARRILGSIPTVDTFPEGSDELALSLQRVFQTPSVLAVLMLDHGIIAAGGSLSEAQNFAELVEESARIAILGSSLENLPE